ncbi:MAG: hypothetical protein MRJ93_03050 [Nitrososphaeraceae archaeon]|nr:hypothetical protein [Nitrososphaeraceae archaeon]
MLLIPIIGHWEKDNTIFLPLIGSLVFITILTVILSDHVYASSPNSTNNTGMILTPNQIAAGGPLPGNISKILDEIKCVDTEHLQPQNAPWFPSVGSTEAGGSGRAHLYPCIHFEGSFSVPNQVYAYQSPGEYGRSYVLETRGPNEMYVYGGPGTLPGAFISRVEVGSLKETWHTTLENNKVSGNWLMPAAINVLADGSIAVTNGRYLYKVNADNGAIEGTVSLPTGTHPPTDSNYDAMEAFKDGTLVLVTANRAVGCQLQGFEAQLKCPTKAPSFLVAVDPKTLKVLDAVQLPELVPARNTVVEHEGKEYIYLVGWSSLFRYEWNGKNLTPDREWGPVHYLTKGQTPANVAAPMGDWVVMMTNGAAASNVSLSVVAVSQSNSSKIVRINPIPLEPGEPSFIPAMLSVDLPNNRIYVWDFPPGKLAAIDFTQDGKMSLAWTTDQRTTGFMTLIGPTDKRVIVGSNINPRDTPEDIQKNNYTEQIVWRDADTGKILALSDYFSPMTQGVAVAPSYGGIMYDLLSNGHIMALQIKPTSYIVEGQNMTVSKVGDLFSKNMKERVAN